MTTTKSEYRCRNCQKLLAYGKSGLPVVEIKCIRCKHINYLFDTEPDQIVITDLDGVVLYANEALADMTGYTIDEMIGKKPSLWGAQMPKSFYEELWHTIKTKKESAVVTLQNKKKNGDLYTALLRISPILDANGNPKFFVGVEVTS